MKAFAYLRVSGKSQLDGDGFPRQRAAVEAYSGANGIEIVEWFEEKAISGETDWFNRPAWMDMIGKLNGTNTIVIEGLDRLARDMGVQEFILKDLKRRHIGLLSTREEDIQNPDPSRVLYRQMMGSIAQYERTMIVLKLRGSRQRKKAVTGRCEGQKPYGHHPAEFAPLQLIREKATQGHTPTAIARMLNASAVPSRRGGKWYPMVVSRILTAENQAKRLVARCAD